jgi:hypothetical protein
MISGVQQGLFLIWFLCFHRLARFIEKAAIERDLDALLATLAISLAFMP